MNCLYLFNPDNDMALASFSPYYMAPASAKKMAADLSALPAWVAEGEGAAVLLTDKSMCQWLNTLQGFFPSVMGTTLVEGPFQRVVPWGWNPSLCKRLSDAGFPGELPSDEALKEIRRLSSRALSVDVLSKLNVAGTLGESFLFDSAEAVLHFLSLHAKALLKAPWSGSGKGIRLVWTAPDASLQGWIKHVLNTQGRVVGEPFYDKVLDFAMEYKVSASRVEWVGYSLFDTDLRGAYKGNRLLSNEGIEQVLTAYVDKKVLDEVSHSLQRELENRLSGRYEGYLGVDMMICRSGEAYAVHPCVEINLRMNMGVVARLFYDRYVAPRAEGNYVVTFYAKEGEALAQHQEFTRRHPLQIDNGRIRSGYLSLTPVLADTRYQVYVLLD